MTVLSVARKKSSYAAELMFKYQLTKHCDFYVHRLSQLLDQVKWLFYSISEGTRSHQQCSSVWQSDSGAGHLGLQEAQPWSGLTGLVLLSRGWWRPWWWGQQVSIEAFVCILPYILSIKGTPNTRWFADDLNFKVSIRAKLREASSGADRPPWRC
jgi:hypothetical protein